MVVKLTVILENDKEVHIRDGVDKEMLEQVAQKQYQEAFDSIMGSKGKAIVEKCEIVKGVYL